MTENEIDPGESIDQNDHTQGLKVETEIGDTEDTDPVIEEADLVIEVTSMIGKDLEKGEEEIQEIEIDPEIGIGKEVRKILAKK